MASMEYVTNKGEIYYVTIDDDGKIEIIEKTVDETPGVMVGEGTEEAPYLIESVEDLVAFSKEVNEGGEIKNKYIKLNTDLNIYSFASYVDYTTTEFNEYFGDNLTLMEELTKGEGFKPIGNSITNGFAGTFDGGGKTITGIYINRTDIYEGMFGVLNNGEIKNLNIDKCNITGEQFIGSLVGYSVGGKINNINTSGNINAQTIKGDVGGLIGCVKFRSDIDSEMLIENINNYVCINIDNEVGKYSYGGILGNACTETSPGSTNCTLKYCRNFGKINCNLSEYAGGVVGGITKSYKYSLYRCSNNGEIVIKNSAKRVGGVSGSLLSDGNGSVIECFNTGNINVGEGTYIGGVVGYQYYTSVTIDACYNTGNINVKTGTSIAGVVGYDNQTDKTNCYNIGEISVNECTGVVAALLGHHNSSGSIGRLKNSYYYMEEKIGAVCSGNNGNTAMDTANAYWVDSETLKNMAETLGESYAPDINNINNGYPVLAFQNEDL